MALRARKVSEAFEKRAPGVSHKLLYELLVARYKLSLACDQAVSFGRARANEAGEGPGRRIEILSFATGDSLLNLLVTSA